MFRLKISFIFIVLALSFIIVLPAAGGTWTETNRNIMIPRTGHTATLLANGKVLVAGGISGSTLNSTVIYDPATGTWSETGNLNNARAGHTATLLTNGKVLVTGGYDQNSDSHPTITEIYDPATGVWTETGSLYYPREGHTATRLLDGRVLVAGGWFASSPYLPPWAEIYDPQTGTWSNTQYMKQPRYRHTATLLSNGTVLVAGGRYPPDDLNKAEVYDPATGGWTETGNLNDTRCYHIATLLPNGTVLIAGGYRNNVDKLKSAEIYDPLSGTWSVTNDMSTVRVYFSATLLPNGTVLVAGGDGNTGHLASSETYDPATGNWTATGDLNTERRFHTATLLPNGTVLVAGGYGDGYLSSCEIYDSATGTWTTRGNLISSRYKDHTTTLLPNGTVLVAGGEDLSYNTFTNAETYNPDTGIWSDTDDLSYKRSKHTATLLPNGTVLVTGGYDGSGSIGNTEIYDPATSTWTESSNLNNARSNHTATLLPDGTVLVAGGINSGNALTKLEIFDPATSTWIEAGNLKRSRTGHTATLLLDGSVLFAGGDAEGITAEIYNPVTGTCTNTGYLELSRSSHTATLLPDGRVIVAGGCCGAAAYSGEIYDPATGIWSQTTDFSEGRWDHTATLLLDGTVLLAGGFSMVSGYPTIEEIYEPATNTWTATDALNGSRLFATATFLLDGKVLLVGGYGITGAQNTSELYSRELGFDTAWQPVLTTVNTILEIGYGLEINGSGFLGISEASSGDALDSPTNHPVAQLRRIGGGQVQWLSYDPDTPVTDTSFFSMPVIDFPDGHALVTVFTNGIPSNSKIILVNRPPSVISIVRGDSSPTNSPNVSFNVTFSEHVTNVDVQDFIPNTTGTLTGSVVSNVTGNGTTYTVTASSYSGKGTLSLDLIDNDTIVDMFGTPLGGTGSGNGDYTGGEVYDIDTIPPTVSYIFCADDNPTKAASVDFTVMFSEDVTGVDALDFNLVESGSLTGSSISNVTENSGNNYTVTVTGYSGDGTLQLNLIDNDTILDSVGNPLGGTGEGNGNFDGNVYSIDMVGPIVTSIVCADPNPTNAASVDFTVIFNENVTGVDTTDFTLPVSNTISGGRILNVTGSNSTYTVTVGNYSGDGTLRLDLTDNNSIIDSVENLLGGTEQHDGDYTSGEVYHIDMIAPTVTSITRADLNPTNAASVNFTVNFSESVTGVDSDDFTLTKTVTDGFVTEVTGSGNTYTVTVSIYSGDGTLRLDLIDNDTILDSEGNPLGSVGAGNGNFVGETYTIDTISPTVISITCADPNPTNAASVNFTVTFSEDVTGVDTNDFILTATVTGGSISNVSENSSNNYTVTVTGYSGEGNLRLDLTDDDSIHDGLNKLGGTGSGNGNYTSGEVYNIDLIAPTVVSIVRADTNPTNAATVDFTVTFSENVTAVDKPDFFLTKTVTEGTVSSVSGSGSTYTVTVSGYSGEGTLRLDVIGNASIADVLGNSIGAGFSGGEMYNIDMIAPTVTSIVCADPNPTNAASVNFTVTFSESVTGVDINDFSLTKTVTGGFVTGVTKNSGSAYTVTVSGYSGEGTLRLDVTDNDTITDTLNPLGGDGTGNGDFTEGQTYTIDMIAPTVTSVAVQSDGLSVDVTFSEPMGNGATTAINYTLSGDGKGTLANNPNSVAYQGGSIYRLTWNTGEMLNGGDITITVSDVYDTAGNLIGAPHSATQSGGAIGTAPTTTAAPYGGTYDTTQTVSLNCDDGTGSGCDVTFYSTDESIPTTPYSGPITIEQYTVLKFFSVDGAGNEELVKTEIYNIDIPTTISCALSESSITYGDSFTVSGKISEAPNAANQGVSIELTPSSGPTVYLSTEADINGDFSLAVDCSDITGAGSWTVKTSWAGDASHSEATSTTAPLTVAQAGSNLTLDIVMSEAIKINNEPIIGGKFTPIPYCMTSDLEGTPITLHITEPDSTEHLIDATTNPIGQFVLDYDASGFAFNALGEWTIKAEFAGNDDYASANSDTITVRVVPTAGYGIIIQGASASGEGLTSHIKTTNFVSEKLIDRQLLPDDIEYFGWDAMNPNWDGLPFKTDIETYITETVKDKMIANAGDLYIVMVNHGWTAPGDDEEGVFYNEPYGSITSSDLGQWLDELQTGLEGTPAEHRKIIVVLGFCRAGAFIDDINGTNRIIIASAAKDEYSHRGPQDVDENGEPLRDGEYFVSEFFKAASYGKSVKDCFEEATTLTEAFAASGSGSVNAPYYDDSLQHPLLDDNGDGFGSNEVSNQEEEDGYNSEFTFIGTSPPTGNDPGDVLVTQTAEAQFLGIADTAVNLWAKVDLPERLLMIWAEVKAPEYDPGDPGEGKQIEMDTFKKATTTYNTNEERYEWNTLGSGSDPADLFATPGTYQVFYFAKDDITRHVSPLKQTCVYKAKENNSPPDTFLLISPDDSVSVRTTLLLDWQDTTDPDGDQLTYTVLLSKDTTSFSNPIRKEGLIYSTCLIRPEDGLEDLSTYYWKVQAIDEYGAIQETGTRVFNTDNTNPVAGWIKGHVCDSISGQPITNAVVTIGSIDLNTALGGYYLGEVPPGQNYTVTAQAPGYSLASYPGVIINEGNDTTVDFGLVLILEDTEPIATIESPSSNVAINQGESVNFQGSITNGNAPFTYTWDFAGGATNSNLEDPGNVTFQTEGVYTVTFTVTDTDEDTDNDSVIVTVSVVDNFPDAINDTASTPEDTPIIISVLTNDDLGDEPTTITAVTQGSNGTVTFTDTTVTYSPNTNFNGPDSFTYTITDNDSDTDTATVTVTMSNVNDAPVVSNIPNQTITEGNTFTTITLDNYVSDVDNTDAEMTWTYTGNTDLIVSINASRVATITTPSSDWNGSEAITFMATDPGSLFDEDAATFTVTAVNDSPIADAGPDQEDVTEGVTVTLNGSGSSDPDGDPITYQWTQTDGTSVTLSDTSAAQPIFIAPNVGPDSESLSFQLTVKDNGGLQDTDAMVINVSNVIIAGDIDDSGIIDLGDAIMALQVVTSITPSREIHKEADVNNDGKIGLAEAIYILQEVSGIR